MQKRTREILALVLLGVFALVGVGAMGYYILVGHNWNVTASNIDDSIGHMDGYTVVLCESPETRVGTSDGSGADVDEIAADYRAKEANVLVVRTSDFTRHRQPYIVRRGWRRIGVLSVGNAELRSEVRADIVHLRRAAADPVIALSDDLTLGSLSADGVIGGLNAIIFDDPGETAPNGEYRGSAYCVRAPEAGKVMAMIISPSGVYSSKVIDDPGDIDRLDAS